ncbi:MAG: hypothetical protein IT323_13435 [Anaerolineae bacterium]|nr:hypothetical protein [Anaerolineae bacterium]
MGKVDFLEIPNSLDVEVILIDALGYQEIADQVRAYVEEHKLGAYNEEDSPSSRLRLVFTNLSIGAKDKVIAFLKEFGDLGAILAPKRIVVGDPDGCELKEAYRQFLAEHGEKGGELFRYMLSAEQRALLDAAL